MELEKCNIPKNKAQCSYLVHTFGECICLLKHKKWLKVFGILIALVLL